MRKTLRQHKIAALKEAKRVIKDNYKTPSSYNPDGRSGICRALLAYSLYDDYDHIKSIAVRELKKYISNSLGSHSFLNSWVRARSRTSHIPKNDDPKMIQTRLNWIDWMIKCLEEDAAKESNGV